MLVEEDCISQVDFDAIRGMVQKIAGISLGDSKRDLVFGRLKRRLVQLGLTSFSQYRALVEAPDGDAERVEMINALTTNLTSFFRESHHFTFLTEVLEGLFKSSDQGRLRIWSAACSSGEEPYSIAMVLHQALQKSGGLQNRRRWDARILATDIDTNMVERARTGCYEAARAASIPTSFNRLLTSRSDGAVEMSGELRKLISFKSLNLLAPWPMNGKFDIIFCRNVVIYFDKTVQRTLFDRMADLLQPNGWLFIGHSESLFRVSDRFESLGRTIYRKIR